MKVGIYDPYVDDCGGGEKYMMTIASLLSTKHSVDVFWDNPQDVEQIQRRFGLDLSKVAVVPNIFSPQFSLPTRLAKTSKYDAIVFLSDGSIPLVLSKKLFLHIQQPLPFVLKKNVWNSFKLSRVNGVFCNSFFTKSFVDRQIHRKTDVIFPPVEIRATHVKKENIILHVGRFRVKNVAIGDYKKQSVMVAAFKQMVDKGLKNWKFVLAVSVMEKDAEQFEEMKKSAKEYPIEFLVNQTNEQLWKVYSKAKIYWHASGYGENLQAHPEYAEHFGIATVEAMGAGAVPVVINAGGQKEIITEGVNGMLWNTLEELQEKTLTLTSKPQKLKELSENARTRALDFSLDAFKQKIFEFIS